ncbi:MAG: hypothetical protein A2W31_05285 [Planctomycetes bacterium RBG_16_64_10]|nr:MAG: hypothetical protein A2W31_05285 [Planctomycetes bacterium RBG_16_64_10]
MFTDDPETPGRGGWEINISHNIERTRDAFFMETPLFDINYGLLDNDQWKIEFPVLYLDSDEHGSHWGMGDLLLGWKYRFLEEEDHHIMASVYPQLLVPTANERVGLGGGNVEALFPLQIGKHFFQEKVFVYGEIGYNVVLGASDANSWRYGLAAASRATERLELMAEVAGLAFPGGTEPDDTFFNVGFKYDFTKRVSLIAAFGRSFHEVNRGTPDLLTFVGLQMMLGGRRGASEGEDTDANRDPVSGREARLPGLTSLWR